jgi:ubiquinone/menaquinone biosynthesis C-methylase UbiE
MNKQDRPKMTYGLLLMAGGLLSCDQGSHAHTMTDAPAEQNHHPREHAHSKHAFTDKANIEAMAKNFESKERDRMQKPDRVIALLGDIKGKIIMDLGAGTGYFSVRMSEKGAHVIAADVSEQFQEYLQGRIEELAITNIELRRTRFDDPLLKDAEADLVFVANTYHHIEDRPKFFTKVKTGLKESGAVVVMDFFAVELPDSIQSPPMAMRVPVDQVVSELKKAGFTRFEVELNELPFQYMIYAR